MVGDVRAARCEAFADGSAHFFSGADGDGGFVDDDGGTGEVSADFSGGSEDVLQVGRAVFVRRGADGDAVGVGVRGGVSEAGGEVQASGGGVSSDDVIQAGFVDGQLALFEAVDFLRADVHAGDVVADFGEAAASDEANVSGSDDDYVHCGFLCCVRDSGGARVRQQGRCRVICRPPSGLRASSRLPP